MSETFTHTAKYRNVFPEGSKGQGHSEPEVVYPPPPEGSFIPPDRIEFYLAEEAKVEIPCINKVGSWGEMQRRLRLDLKTRPEESDSEIEVIVLEGVWECDARKIILRIEDLLDKIRRRNMQIENLRHELASTRQMWINGSRRTEATAR